MVRVSLSLGIIATVAGLVAVGFGIPIQAFGLGNTLIVAGSMVFSAGLIVIVLSMVLGAIDRLSTELRRPVVEPSGSHASFEHQPAAPPVERPVAPPQEWPSPAIAPPRDDVAHADRAEPRRAPMPPRSGWQDDGAGEPAAPPPPRPPGAPVPRRDRDPFQPPRVEREAAARARLPGRAERPPREPATDRQLQAPEPERRREPATAAERRDDPAREPRTDPYAPPERRRIFGWTRRSKERHAEPAAGAEPETEPPFGAPAGAVASGHAPAGTDEGREMPHAPAREPPPERRDRAAAAARTHPRGDQVQPVEVLKQGTVDGMSYTLYTDGSIDAEFPEGRIRFNSIEELRQHLEAEG